MESKTSSGQILIECALGLFILALLFSFILEFDGYKKGLRGKTGQQKIQSKQKTNFTEYRNGN